jgi:hypothetical protein
MYIGQVLMYVCQENTFYKEHILFLSGSGHGFKLLFPDIQNTGQVLAHTHTHTPAPPLL